MIGFLKNLITEATVIAAVITTGAIIITALISSTITVASHKRERTAEYIRTFVRSNSSMFSSFISELEFFAVLSKHFPNLRFEHEFVKNLPESAAGDILALCRKIVNRVSFMSLPGKPDSERHFVHHKDLDFIRGIYECKKLATYETWENTIKEFKELMLSSDGTNDDIMSWMNAFIVYLYNHIVVITCQPWFCILFGPYKKLRNHFLSTLTPGPPYPTFNQWNSMIEMLNGFLAGIA